jgi:hypothetical protein
MEMSSGTTQGMMMMAGFAPLIVAPATPVTGLTFTPALTPEPSTLSLLLAGSAALFRFGWRKRSN